MTLLAVTFFALGFADLARDHENPRSCRTALAVLGAVGLAGGVVRLAGLPWSTVGIIALAELSVLVSWVVADARETTPIRAIVGLLLVLGAPAAAFATSGAVPEVSGDLERWFSNLAIKQPKESTAPDQALVALAASVFLLASANRIVRLVLTVAKTQTAKAETTLKGGRLIGPMERLFILAMLVAGEPGGIAIIIAAKGLLRLPEIQRSPASPAVDELTEYFLIGTLSSLLVAVACGGAVLVIA